MFTTVEELQDFKKKITVLLDSSKPVALNDLCNIFKLKYGLDFKRWFKLAFKPIPKALNLFQNYMTDITELDFKTKAPEILVIRKQDEGSKKKKKGNVFQEQLKYCSQSDCERKLKASLHNFQGTSKNNPIQINDESATATAAAGTEFFEFDYKEQTFPYTVEFKSFKSDVSKFKQYRDYQMIHIAYVKLRLVTVFHHTGKSKMHFHTICALFRQLFNESFFQTGILKHYVTSGPERDANILTFLKRFCGDFLFVNDQKEASICRSMSSLITKFISSLVKAVEKLQQQQQQQQHEDQGIRESLPPPQNKAQMIMGSIAADDITVDVRRSTEHIRFGGGPSNTNVGHNFLDFPGLVREDFTIARPTLSEVNERVNEIRNRICQEHRVVKITEVIYELCTSFNVASIKDIRPLESREVRRESDIPALNNLMKLQGKVNAFAQSFTTFRNICTLHELEEELCKMEATQAFDDLKLGPLQKQLIVYDLFQFPADRPDIPPITTYDIFRLLWKCYDEKYKKEKKTLRLPDGSTVASKDLHVKIMLPDFMEYVRKTYGFKTAEESGLRINNVGYALQATRKAWFSDLHNIKKVTQKFKDQLSEDFLQQLEFAKKKTLGTTLCSSGPEIILDDDRDNDDNDDDDDAETLHQKIANMPLLDAFNVAYDLLQTFKREACKTLPTTAHLVNFSDITMNALAVIQKDQLMSDIFHILLSIAPLKALGKENVKILKYLGFNDALNAVNEQAETTRRDSVNGSDEKIFPKSHVTSTVKKWLTKSPSIDLKSLATIESQITGEVNQQATVFDSLGHGSFLKFITSNESLAEVLEFGFSLPFEMLGSRVTKEELIQFVKACGEGKNTGDLATSIQMQFNINCCAKDIKQLQQMSAENKSNNPPNNSCILSFQHAFLCASELHKDTKESSRNKQKLTQLACKRILESPLLVDLQEYTNWNIMFRSKLGAIKDFLDAYYNKKNNNEVPFQFFELSAGRYIKVLKHCSLEDFKSALDALNPEKTSSCILALLLSSMNFQDAPLSMLTNHMQNVLMAKVGRNYQPDSEIVQQILKFTLECFALIPFEILCCIARKVFLTRLGAVLGTQKVGKLLLQAALKNFNQRRLLHGLGFYLSVNEWMEDAEKFVVDDTCDVKKDEISCIKDLPKKCSETQTKVEPIKDDVELLSDGELPESEDGDVTHVEMVPEKLKQDEKCETQEEDANKEDNRIEHCRKFIENIRHYEFGIGMEFGEKEQRLLDIHREREGRSLNRLSRELYTKDSHFVLELVQNADDNEYPDVMIKQETAEKPAVAFILEEERVTILNNEIGFEERNIRALCDIGKSTKGLHRKGYIGQKGIGFKSVFRVTEEPEIHSNGFHIKFDAISGPNGYILPLWIDPVVSADAKELVYSIPSSETPNSWATKIVLPLKKEMQHAKLTSRFHDIHPSLLLFLNRLHTIVVDDKVAGTVKVMSKEKLKHNLVKLTENDKSTLWFVVSKEIPVQLQEEVKHTDISIAFPLVDHHDEKHELLPFQPIFAYLPLRSYGFKFIIQADFEVPSSREDVDIDSAWNQCILHYIPQLVAEAFVQFKEHPHFMGLQGVVEYFKFLDMEDHVLGSFKQVARNIITCVKREPCMPAADHDPINNRAERKWSLPSALVYGCDSLRSTIPPKMLFKYLGLDFVSAGIQQDVPFHVLESLGVSKLSIEQLVDIAKAVLKDFHQGSTGETTSTKEVDRTAELDRRSGHCTKTSTSESGQCIETSMSEEGKITELHRWIGQWFVVLYKTLQDSCDYSDGTMSLVRSLKMFPLCDGLIVSLQGEVVFFPVDCNTKTRKVHDPLNEVEKDLNILSRDLYSNLDQIQQEQVRRLLKDVGVKSMTPSDLITNHIIPLFKEGHWQSKPDRLIVSCVCYLRQQLVTDSELFDVGELKEHVVLKTNKGLKKVCDHQIFLPCEYGNSMDLQKMFPACDWTLVSAQYITGHSSIERRAWYDFFTTLGLHTFISPRQNILQLHRSDLCNSPWKDLSNTWPQTEGTMYTIEDIAVPEFDLLLASKDDVQITTFAFVLNDAWKKRLEKYDFGKALCRVKDTNGRVVATTHFSFYIKMREAKWIPSTDEDKELFVPRDLYQKTSAVERVFAQTVDYLSPKIRNTEFIAILGVENQVKVSKFIDTFRRWSAEKVFSTSCAHVFNIYEYIRDVVTTTLDDEVVKELMRGNCIFLPNQEQMLPTNECTMIEGRFYKVKEVCWEDPSNVVELSQDTYGTRRVLKGFYPDAMYSFFVNTLHVPLYPTTSEYLNAVYNLVNRTCLPDNEACMHLYTMFHVLGQKTVIEEKMAEFKNWGVPDDQGERRALYHSMEAFVDPEMMNVIRSPRNATNRLLPTLSRQFKAICDKPVLCIDDKVRHIYDKVDNLEIVFLNDITDVFKATTDCPSHLRRAKQREVENIVLFTMLFYRACGLELLSDLHCPPEILAVVPSPGCYFWEVLLHNITPAVQRFIAEMFPRRYNEMKAKKFGDMLQSKVEINTVSKLEVVHTLKGRGNVVARRSQLCIVQHVQDTAFSKENGRKCIVYICEQFSGGQQFGEQIMKELMGIFMENDEDNEKREFLKEFILTYTTVLNKEAYMRRKQIPKLSNDEQLWEFPLPKHTSPVSPKTSKEGDESTLQVLEIVEDYNTADDETEKREVPSDKNEPPRKRVKNAQQTPTVGSSSVRTTDNPQDEGFMRKQIPQMDFTNTSNAQCEDKDQVECNSTDGHQQTMDKATGVKRKHTGLGEAMEESSVDTNNSRNNNGKTTDTSSNNNQSTSTDPQGKPVNEWFLDYHNAQRMRHNPRITSRVDVMEQYEDLPMQVNKAIDVGHISVDRMLKSKDPDGQIGKLGESMVYSHLCEEYKDELAKGLIEIEWLNEDEEHWLPYDMKLTFYDQRRPPIVYVEVKATYLDEKKEFEISANQIKFAFEQGARYHLYRLSGLRNAQEIKLRRLANLAMYLENKSVKLFMIL